MAGTGSIIQMKLCDNFPTLPSTSSSIPFLHRRTHRPTLPSGPSHWRLRVVCSLSESSDSLGVALQEESLRILEWPSLCNRLSDFASTSMAVCLTRTASIPIGTTPEESRKLLDQTAAALHLMEAMEFEQLSLSDVEDISGIVRFAVSGQLLTIRELCTVRRTLCAARSVWEKLAAAAETVERVPPGRLSPLLEVLQNCNFLTELEQKIGFCIDCKLLIVLDRASEDLELIRAERKRNIENLDSLLKEVSLKIYQAGGIDKPLITRRRSRMCVAVRASHKHLLPDCVVLNVSSSGVTYFVEPKEAVDLNNIEVQLSNSERAEEMTILSLLTSEIAQSEVYIKSLLDRVLELDLAFTRAAYAQLVNGVCPVLESYEFESSVATAEYSTLSVDIEGMQHPLLLRHHLGKAESLSNGETPSKLDVEGGKTVAKGSLRGPSRLSVPIDIKVGCGKRIVVISGPNTGGKTASMKTLGIASVMSKAGIFLPAKTNPRLPWFDLVLADIGDSQSLEQNLSTFSGHISRISKILEVTSTKSLVLIDEIGSGTDPTEGVALSSSILLYLKQRVNLAVVTTHYADLSLLKDKDPQFENAAMEFSVETLRPTYQILWGSTGVSNALSIAKSIGFDKNIIEGAKNWLETLKPEKQKERKGLLYQSLVEERNKMASQFKKAASLHSDVMELYHEIRLEAEDLDSRVLALKKNMRQKVQEELITAKYQINTVMQEFENEIRTASDDEYNSLIKRAESAIASIVKAHHHPDSTFSSSDSDTSLYRPQSGEKVRVKGLGNKLATVVETSGDDDVVLVQYGKMRVRVSRYRISRATSSSKRNPTRSFHQDLRIQFGMGHQNTEIQLSSATKTNEDASHGPLLRTSKNSIDLRGMRVEEAAHQLEMAIASRGTQSVLFVVHGMGTGAVKDRALELLKSHPRVTKIEQESPMNYGCTVAYIK